MPEEKPGLRVRLAAAVARGRARWKAYRDSFVFKEEMHGWPKVRRLAPGKFVLSAPHASPRRMQKYGGWKPPVYTGAALGVLWGLGADPGAFWPVAIFSGAIFGFLSIPVWHWIQSARLKIRVDHGTLQWRGPDRRRYTIKPENRHGFEVLVPHRLARAEALAHENFMRSYPRGHRPEPLFQISSELVAQTGLRGTVYAPVAEFYNDLSEEQATRLHAAIGLVLAVSEREAESKGRTA